MTSYASPSTGPSPDDVAKPSTTNTATPQTQGHKKKLVYNEVKLDSKLSDIKDVKLIRQSAQLLLSMRQELPNTRAELRWEVESAKTNLGPWACLFDHEDLLSEDEFFRNPNDDNTTTCSEVFLEKWRAVLDRWEKNNPDAIAPDYLNEIETQLIERWGKLSGRRHKLSGVIEVSLQQGFTDFSSLGGASRGRKDEDWDEKMNAKIVSSKK